MPHFYTNQMTIQRGSWSWDRSETGLESFFSVPELVWTLVSTTAWNGTLVVNIGPAADGTVPTIFQDRLAGLGAWLTTNGEAIYGTRPWDGALPSGAEPAGGGAAKNGTFYTAKAGAVYAIALAYPAAGPDGTRSLPLTLSKGAAAGATKAELLTADGPVGLSWAARADGGMDVNMPPPPLGSAAGWVVRLAGLGAVSWSAQV